MRSPSISVKIENNSIIRLDMPFCSFNGGMGNNTFFTVSDLRFCTVEPAATFDNSENINFELRQ